jgi:hypothetical protein
MILGARCTAHTTRGKPCNGPAVTGTGVCRVHGGSAPQVIAAARRRILAAADPVAARLIEIATSKTTVPRDAIVAARDLLDRAGLLAEAPSTGTSNGTVLWEEFCPIHRRVVGGGAANAEEE